MGKYTHIEFSTLALTSLVVTALTTCVLSLSLTLLVSIILEELKHAESVSCANEFVADNLDHIYTELSFSLSGMNTNR